MRRGECPLRAVGRAGGAGGAARDAGGFDLVFTTWGTVGWYPDIARWGQVVGHFLRPGGVLCFADMHPAAAVFGCRADPADAERRPGWLMPYLSRVPLTLDDRTDYASPVAVLANSRTVNWLHPVADIFGALREVGLVLDWLHEHPRLTWQMFPGLV